MIRAAVAVSLVALISLAQQPPPLPEQQPFLIRHTNLCTNVVVSVTTTITEVQGFKVDHQFYPQRTNLLFRTSTNIWSTP